MNYKQLNHQHQESVNGRLIKHHFPPARKTCNNCVKVKTNNHTQANQFQTINAWALEIEMESINEGFANTIRQ